MSEPQALVWGNRRSAHPRPTRGNKWRRITPAPVEVQLASFLSEVVKSWKPTRIVVGERKGTAILRALADATESGFKWPWSRVISTTALEQTSLTDDRLLYFDDMVRTGSSTAAALVQLEQQGFKLSPERLKLVYFAAHVDSSTNGALERNDCSIAWYCRELRTVAYAGIRRRLIEFLQRSGSLMLDTEHLEVRIKINRGFGFSDLEAALRRRGKPVVFGSLAGRTNLTVFYGDDPAHHLPPERFPAGIGYTNIVKKTRLVQRAPNEFALIPICLPSIPARAEEWIPTENDRRLLGEGYLRSSIARFYAVALLGSLYPLEWTLKDLYAYDGRAFTVSLPARSDAPVHPMSYTLDHLGVMYPTLDTDCLVREIARVEERARTFGSQVRRRKHASDARTSWSMASLRHNAMDLLQLIAYTVDFRAAERRLQDDGSREECKGLRAREIFDLASRLGWEGCQISTLFDILIDEGNLVTRVEQYKSKEGERRLARTFQPDGEVVTELVRRFTNQWGLPLAI